MISQKHPAAPTTQQQKHTRKRLVFLLGSLLLLLFVLLFCPLPGYAPVAMQQAWAASSVFEATIATAQNVQPIPVKPRTTGQSPATISASKALVRINQLDPSQYDSPANAAIWAYSACSAASLTEVINAYGFRYRIADILHVEAQNGWITPQSGLLAEGNLAKTAALFGFKTTWGHSMSLDQVIAIANAGRPVIVSWPPQTYNGGHIVVVVGGDKATVRLVDSSRYNRTSLSRAQFLAWWRGTSWILTPPADLLAGKPTISAAFINEVLAAYHSPAAGTGQALYTLGVQYDIDPVYALAFFLHESRFGTQGEARVTLSLGNERCLPDRPCIDQDRGGYAKMYSWQDGFVHWYRLIVAYENGALTYQQSGRWLPLTSLDSILPTYAPSSDGNDEATYIAAVQHAVATWRGGKFWVT